MQKILLMDTIKTDKYYFEPLSTHFSAMFVYKNQQEGGVLKYCFQLYTGIGRYPVLDWAEMLWNEISPAY